jgi:hypothetical protein
MMRHCHENGPRGRSGVAAVRLASRARRAPSNRTRPQRGHQRDQHRRTIGHRRGGDIGHCRRDRQWWRPGRRGCRNGRRGGTAGTSSAGTAERREARWAERAAARQRRERHGGAAGAAGARGTGAAGRGGAAAPPAARRTRRRGGSATGGRGGATAGTGGGGTAGAGGSGTGTATFMVQVQLASAVNSAAPGTIGIVTWTVNVSALTEAHIDFGLDTSYGMTAPVDLTLTDHRTLLLGMKPRRCTTSASSLATRRPPT